MPRPRPARGRALALAALAAACLLAAAAPGAAEGPSPSQARQELLARLEALDQRLERSADSLAALAAELEELARRRGEALGRRAELARERRAARRRLALVEAQLEGLARLDRRQRQGFHRRLRALYLHGADASEALWASAQDLADALSRSQALTRLVRADRRRLEAIASRRAELGRLRSELAARQAELAELEREQKALAGRLERLAGERARLRDRTRRRRSELAEARQALQEAQARLARTFALPPPGSPRTGVLEARGGLSPPVEGRVVGREGRRGVVLAARSGAPVRAPWAGTVVFAAPLAGYGRVVVLDHGSRVHTVLAHLGAVSVEPGQLCAPGQVVGAVDGTGRLYLEVRRAARPVDPLAWLRLKP
jgi:septal ring factor EnvC (AmiA/AmiB activator)